MARWASIALHRCIAAAAAAGGCGGGTEDAARGAAPPPAYPRKFSCWLPQVMAAAAERNQEPSCPRCLTLGSDCVFPVSSHQVMAAIAECTKNPMAIFNYQNDPEVGFVAI